MHNLCYPVNNLRFKTFDDASFEYQFKNTAQVNGAVYAQFNFHLFLSFSVL